MTQDLDDVGKDSYHHVSIETHSYRQTDEVLTKSLDLF